MREMQLKCGTYRKKGRSLLTSPQNELSGPAPEHGQMGFDAAMVCTAVISTYLAVERGRAVVHANWALSQAQELADDNARLARQEATARDEAERDRRRAESERERAEIERDEASRQLSLARASRLTTRAREIIGQLASQRPSGLNAMRRPHSRDSSASRFLRSLDRRSEVGCCHCTVRGPATGHLGS